jgi:hypothetical protein
MTVVQTLHCQKCKAPQPCEVHDSDPTKRVCQRCGWNSPNMQHVKRPHVDRMPTQSDFIEALGNVRKSDSAPYEMTWAEILDAIHELRAERDELLKG